MSNREVESLFYGLRWMTSRSHVWNFIDVSYEILNSCLKYGMWMNGWREILAQPFYGRVECRSPILGLDFALLTKGYLSFYFYENFDGLYVVYMDVLSWIFMFLLCCLCMCFMKTTFYGSHHVFTYNWIINISMT